MVEHKSAQQAEQRLAAGRREEENDQQWARRETPGLVEWESAQRVFGELWLNLNPSLVKLQRPGVTCHRQYQIIQLRFLVNIYGDHSQAKIGVSNDRDGTKMTLTLLQCLQLVSDINWIVVQQQY